MRKPKQKEKLPPPGNVGASVSNCNFEIGKFQPTPEHCQAVAEIARALKANADAAAALTNTLKPPSLDNAVGLSLSDVKA